jgi:serine/threonine protein kinase
MDSSPLNEKIDVYSMGNVFYYILTKERPFGDLSGDEVQERIRHGERPYKGIDVLKNSTHWATQALIHAMEWCWTHNATDRPTARTIQMYLESQLEQAHVVGYATMES